MRLKLSCIPVIMVSALCMSMYRIHAQEFQQEVQMKSPTLVDPELNDKWFAKGLCQHDFDSGTLRITEPGCYYLKENIVFNPVAAYEATRTDKPADGWPAIVSIEADNVNFDLNTKSLTASLEYLQGINASTGLPNVLHRGFAGILLNNSLYSPYIARALGVAEDRFFFEGEAVFKAAHNVVIRNGTIGTVQRGVAGAHNTAVFVYDLVIKDLEQGGISLLGVQGAEVKQSCISGLQHHICFDHDALYIWNEIAALEHLAALETTPEDVKAQALYFKNALLPLVADGTKKALSDDGQVYGVSICPPSIVADDEVFHNSCVTVETVSICSLAAQPREELLIESKMSGILRSDIFGLRWFDAYAGVDNSFAPNVILKAAVFLDAHTPELHKLPQPFVDTILAAHPSEALFLMQVKPHASVDWYGYAVSGIAGICAFGADCSVFKDCSITDLRNNGEHGYKVATVPGGSSDEQVRYTGNDVAGFAGLTLSGGHVADIVVCHCTSEYGYAYGLLLEQCSGMKVQECAARSICSNGDAPDAQEVCKEVCTYDCNCCDCHLTKSVCTQCCTHECHEVCVDVSTVCPVNPPSCSFGFAVTDGSRGNWLSGCQACKIKAPRCACGFLVAQSACTQIKESKAYGISAFSFKNLLADPKLAAGFKTDRTVCTVFEQCETTDVRADNEPAGAASVSRAVGFALFGTEDELDVNSVVHQSKTTCNDGGQWAAIGVLLNNTACAVVTETEASYHTKGQRGFGIRDMAENSTAMILKNHAVNNATKNYSVMYTHKGQSLPVSTGTNVSTRNLEPRNPWNNVLIEKGKKGKEQVKPRGKVVTSVFQAVSC